MSEYTQYRVAGKTFAPVGRIKLVKKLPTGYYSVGWGEEGPEFRQETVVMDSLVEIPDEAADKVRGRVRSFRSVADKYRQFGVIHKTGILVYGPPATGKTVLIQSLALEFAAAGDLVFEMARPSIMIHALRQVRQVEPDRLIVVTMEDIEAHIERHEEELLALLDGSAQVGGIVYLATTNHFETLPDRIRNRPSRFDETVYLGMPSEKARLAYLKARVGTLVSGDELATLAAETHGFSFGHLKDAVISVHCLGQPQDEVIDRLRKMGEVTPAKPDGATVAAPATSSDDSQF